MSQKSDTCYISQITLTIPVEYQQILVRNKTAVQSALKSQKCLLLTK